MPKADEVEQFPNTGRFLAGRARDVLSVSQKAVLESLVARTETVADRTRIIAQGDTCDQSTMLIEGFMVRTLDAPDRRYAVSFHVPGDFVDLHCFALKRLDHNIDCVGPARIGYVPHDRLRETIASDPDLARLFWFSTLLDAVLHREWILKLEQLTTPRRMAHIFAEIWHRLEMVGLASPDGFDTPLTQSDLADMCGSTPIHANRAVAELRKRGIADFQRGNVIIRDRAELETYADFSPDYLYGEGELALREGDFRS